MPASIASDSKRTRLRAAGSFLFWAGLALYLAVQIPPLYHQYLTLQRARFGVEQARAMERAKTAELELRRAKPEVHVKEVIREVPVEPQRLLPGMRFDFSPPIEGRFFSFNSSLNTSLGSVRLLDDGIEATIVATARHERGRATVVPETEGLDPDLGEPLTLTNVECDGKIVEPRERVPRVEFYPGEQVTFTLTFTGQVHPYARRFRFVLPTWNVHDRMGGTFTLNPPPLPVPVGAEGFPSR